MPLFHIETTQGTFEIEANREPSSDDIQQLVASGSLQAQKDPRAPDAPYSPDPLHPINGMGSGMLAGQPRGIAPPGGAQAFDASAGIVAPGVAYALGGPLAGVATQAAGSSLVQGRRVLMGEQPDFRAGEVVKDTALAAIPGSKTRGVVGLASNAARFGAGAAVGEEARSLIDDKKLASSGNVAVNAGMGSAAATIAPAVSAVLGRIGGNAAEGELARVAALKTDKAMEDASLTAIQDRGGVIVPSKVNDSWWNQFQESLAGQINLKNEVSKRNAPVLKQIAGEEASMLPGAQRTPADFEAARDAIGKPYQDAAALGMGDEVKLWRDANTRAKAASRELKESGYTVDREAKLKAATDDADNAHAAIEIGAIKRGRQDLADQLSQARVKFAKNYDVEEATNVGNGEVNAAVLEQMLKNRGPQGVTGGLADIAKFNAAAPGMARPTAGMATAPSAASSGASLMGVAAGTGGAEKAAAGALPWLRNPIRDRILSPEYQANYARRSYDPKSGGTDAETDLIRRIMLQVEAAKMAKARQ